jgi:hypothetical protein
MPPPHDLISDRVEHARGLHPANPAPPSALEKRRGLRQITRSVAAGIPDYPAIPPGISGDRNRAFRRQREKVSPGRFEMGMGMGMGMR